MELTRLTPGDECRCILEGGGPEETLPECLAGKGSRPNVGSTYASMYLCQQLQSFLSRDALQFHNVRSLPVQDVIDELVYGTAMGYFFRFFLLLRKLPCLEESDGMLLLGNVAEIQNFPTCHQDLSTEKLATSVQIHLHTFLD